MIGSCIHCNPGLGCELASTYSHHQGNSSLQSREGALGGVRSIGCFTGNAVIVKKSFLKTGMLKRGFEVLLCMKNNCYSKCSRVFEDCNNLLQLEMTPCIVGGGDGGVS